MPGYRVRLFLSVDLTGSTAFKAKNTSFDWLKEFQKFYGGFPKIFGNKYSTVCKQIHALTDDEQGCVPKVWKTIGDEILFVNRVNSITHLGAYVSAFAEALVEFGMQVSKHDLNTKGNGWIAAFPSPNCSIKIDLDEESDPIAGRDDLPTETFESDVDQYPQRYDFLGKGIDGGFRISRNSSVDTFTISPALAYLLAKAKTNPDTTGFSENFRFHEPQTFRGVLNGQRYPIVSIDTVRGTKEKELGALEAKLLQKPNLADDTTLRKYLKEFIDHNGIEMPHLRVSGGEAEVTAPDHYRDYAEQWEADYATKKRDERSLTEDVASTRQNDETALETPRETGTELFSEDGQDSPM